MYEFEPGYEDPVALLARAAEFADIEDEGRWELIRRLHMRTDAAAFAATAEAAGAANLRLRLVAVAVLGQLGYRANRPYLEQTLPILLSAIDHAEDPTLIEGAVYALAHLGDGRALTPVLRHVGHRDDDVRQAVAFALTSLTDPEQPATSAVQAMLELTRDTAEDVRDWATFGLGEQWEVDSAEIRAALAARLGDEEVIAAQAREGLAKRGVTDSPRSPGESAR